MANRHHHKKLRAAIRRHMETTGDSYQKAYRKITERMRARPPKVDLVAFRYFGIPMTIAIWEAADNAIAMLLPRAEWPNAMPAPRSPLIGGWMLRGRAH